MKKVFKISALLLGLAVSLCSCGANDPENKNHDNNKALVSVVGTNEKYILKDDNLEAYSKNDTVLISFSAYGDRQIISLDGRKAVIQKYL